MTEDEELKALLRTVPMEMLMSELGRRRSESRKTHAPGGRKVLIPCPACGQMFGVRELRRHKPECPATKGSE